MAQVAALRGWSMNPEPAAQAHALLERLLGNWLGGGRTSPPRVPQTPRKWPPGLRQHQPEACGRSDPARQEVQVQREVSRRTILPLEASIQRDAVTAYVPVDPRFRNALAARQTPTEPEPVATDLQIDADRFRWLALRRSGPPSMRAPD